MVFELSQYWDAAIDGIQIVLCFFILLFLIRNRKQNRKPGPDNAIREAGQRFNAQLVNQTLKQQVDQAFANIAATIAAEQSKLEQVLPLGDSGTTIYDFTPYPSELDPSVNPEISPIAGNEPDSDPLHEQIQKLADKGMTVRQISDELKTPLGEVELVLSLRSSLEN